MEHDINGRQFMVYKVIKYMHNTKKDTAISNIIPEYQWLDK